MLELKLEDLLEEMCEHCQGTGEDPRMSPPGTFPEIGRRSDLSGKCQKCNGLGAKLTPTGKLIRDFVNWLNRTGQIGSNQ